MQEAILILCAVAGIMTATLLRRGKVDTEASILELSIKKLETDTSYAAEKDVLLPIYNNKLKNLKSNSTKESHVIQTTEQTTDSVSSVKQDVKSDRIGATSTSKSDIQDKLDNVTKIAPTAKTDVGSKPDTTKTVGIDTTSELQQKSKSDIHAKPSVATPRVLPADDSGKKSKPDTGEVVGADTTPTSKRKSAKPERKLKIQSEGVVTDTTPTSKRKSAKPERKLKIQSEGVVTDTTPTSKRKSAKPERKLKIQSEGVVAQESGDATGLNVEPQSTLSTKGTVAQDLPTIINVESEADTSDVELKNTPKMDVTLQTSPAEPDTKSVNKTPDEAKSIVKPSKNIESVIDDDIDEEELEKIKNSVKEALAKLERAESE